MVSLGSSKSASVVGAAQRVIIKPQLLKCPQEGLAWPLGTSWFVILISASSASLKSPWLITIEILKYKKVWKAESPDALLHKNVSNRFTIICFAKSGYGRNFQENFILANFQKGSLDCWGSVLKPLTPLEEWKVEWYMGRRGVTGWVQGNSKTILVSKTSRIKMSCVGAGHVGQNNWAILFLGHWLIFLNKPQKQHGILQKSKILLYLSVSSLR